MPRDIYEVGLRLEKGLRHRYPGIDPAKHGVDVAAGTKDGVRIGIASAASIAVNAFRLDGGMAAADTPMGSGTHVVEANPPAPAQSFD